MHKCFYVPYLLFNEGLVSSKLCTNIKHTAIVKIYDFFFLDLL